MSTKKPVVEILAQIDAPHYCCGIVLHDDRVVEAADIVKWMKGWTRARVRNYCADRKFRITVVHRIERNDL